MDIKDSGSMRLTESPSPTDLKLVHEGLKMTQ